MKPKRIFLIRHAQSHGNVTREVHATVPDWKITLTEKGHEQARFLGRGLADEIGDTSLAVYLSPYARTRETWAGIRTELVTEPAFIKEDPRLREQAWGNLRAFEPRTWQDIEAERDHYGPFFYKFLHGECGGEVYDRCTGFLETLYRDFEKSDMPENVLIVTHGFTLRVLLMRWLHWSVETFHELSNPRNCERFELRLDPVTDRYGLTAPFPKKGDRPPHEAGGHQDKKEPLQA